jgi:hypothetical protein
VPREEAASVGELGSAWTVRIDAGWSAVAPLAGSVAGAVVLVGVALALHWATRPQRRRWHRLLIAGVWVLAACFGAIAALGLAAIAARSVALVATADAIWCAPWRDAVRWVDVASVSGYEKKARFGWRALGFELSLHAKGVQPVAPPPVAPESWPGRLALALARTDGGLPPIPGWTIGQRARPSATLACFGLGLEVAGDRVYRAVRELAWATGPGPRQVADRRVLHWCVSALPPFSWECLSQAHSLHQPCREERGEGYAACLTRAYSGGTWIGGPPPPALR